jgi:hypothetical protein
LDVRRLAALDMHGLASTQLRRRVVVAEFVLGAVGCVAVGLLTAARAPGSGWRVLGVRLVGIGVNYLALALHAISLLPAGALDAELAGVDVGESSGGTRISRSGSWCRCCWSCWASSNSAAGQRRRGPADGRRCAARWRAAPSSRHVERRPRAPTSQANRHPRPTERRSEMFDPYQFQMVLRREEVTRAEWLEAEEQAGQIARALTLLGRDAVRRVRAWRRRMPSIPTGMTEVTTS